MGPEFMDHLICKVQINKRINILSPVKVVFVFREVLSQPVIIVDHTCYSVETEAVKLILFKPVPAVG